MAAIFDLRLTPTSHNSQISAVVFLDYINAGLVLGFPLVPCIEVETSVFHICFRQFFMTASERAIMTY